MYTSKLEDFVKEFDLHCETPDIDISKKIITRKEINRPALQLTGFFHRFDHDRIQVIGQVEQGYLESLTPAQRRSAILGLFEHRIPCLIVCKGQKIFPEMYELASKFQVPVYTTNISTTESMAEMTWWLRHELADRVTLHGVLIDIYGEGVLIIGESGIGKSETALELIKRGHRLIADDAVEIKKIADKTLMGICPEIIRYYIELRGIGIINVKELFGAGAVKEKQVIDMIIRLEIWKDDNSGYDRLGLNEEYMDILNNKVLCKTVPIRPGRNVAIICESAAINNRQEKMGKGGFMQFQEDAKMNGY